MAGDATAHTTVAKTPSPITHFSHPHELSPLPLQNPRGLCDACRLRSSGVMYTCLPCAFILHQSCAELPRLIAHPSHAGCILSLLTTASYPGGIFSCDACRRRGDGWTYHCGRCEYDLHVTCACRPMRVRVPSHGSCELQLTFANPYPKSNGFACDVCRKIGTKQWLYHCAACEFDVHLDCAAAPPPPPPEPALQRLHSLPATGLSSPSDHGSGTDARNPFSSSAPQPPAMQQRQSTHGSLHSVTHQFPGRVSGERNDPPGGGFEINWMMAALQGPVEEEICGGEGAAPAAAATTGGGGGDVSLY